MQSLAVIGLGVVLALAAARSADAQGYHLVGDPEVYTQVNLHPDEGRRRLYSINYQQPGLMILCTKVRIQSLDPKQMTFLVVDSGRQYTYLFHKATTEPIPKHLDRYFGKTCSKSDVEAMSQDDRDGILSGRATVGMTKAGVIKAIGYPPEHATPSLESNAWRYWKSRFDTMIVHFADGKVARIQD